MHGMIRGIQHILICLMLVSSFGNGSRIELGALDESFPLLEKLRIRKAELDSSRKHQKMRLEILVKEPGKAGLTPVVNNNWPTEFETTYDLWKDANGRVLVLGEYPYSQSGDWHLGLEHYFNENGETFAFEKKTNFFNSPCINGVAFETETKYFNKGFSIISKEHTLKDIDGNTLDIKKCRAAYNWPYKVSRNLADCISKI